MRNNAVSLETPEERHHAFNCILEMVMEKNTPDYQFVSEVLGSVGVRDMLIKANSDKFIIDLGQETGHHYLVSGEKQRALIATFLLATLEASPTIGVLNTLSAIYMLDGKPTTAVDYAKQALKLAEDNDSTPDASLSHLLTFAYKACTDREGEVEGGKTAVKIFTHSIDEVSFEDCGITAKV